MTSSGTHGYPGVFTATHPLIPGRAISANITVRPPATCAGHITAGLISQVIWMFLTQSHMPRYPKISQTGRLDLHKRFKNETANQVIQVSIPDNHSASGTVAAANGGPTNSECSPTNSWVNKKRVTKWVLFHAKKKASKWLKNYPNKPRIHLAVLKALVIRPVELLKLPTLVKTSETLTPKCPM